MTRTLYAGSYTGCGFEHFYQEWLPRGEGARVCLLKGAPGTGKGAMLQTLAAAWERQGRQVTVFASAREPGLPEAVISGRDAVACAALLREEELPFARVVDLDACLDGPALRAVLPEAETLSRRIARLRRRASRCLQGAAAALADTAAVYAGAADPGAVCNLRMELLQWMGGTPGPARRMFPQAVTPAGVVSGEAPLARANTLCLDLPWGLDADALLYPVAVALNARGTGYEAGMQMLDGQKIACLCTDSHAILSHVETGRETRTLRLDEGVLRREREALAFNRAACDLWMGQAVEALAAARDCRAQLARLTADALRPDTREDARAEVFSFFMDL